MFSTFWWALSNPGNSREQFEEKVDCCLKLLHFLPDSKVDQGSFGRFSSQALSFQRCRARSNGCRPKRIGNGQLHSFQGAVFFCPRHSAPGVPLLGGNFSQNGHRFWTGEAFVSENNDAAIQSLLPCYPNTRCHPDPVNQLHVRKRLLICRPQKCSISSRSLSHSRPDAVIDGKPA